MCSSEESFVCTHESFWKRLLCARPRLSWGCQRNQPHLFPHPHPALGCKGKGGTGGACVPKGPPRPMLAAWELIRECLPLNTDNCRACFMGKGFCFKIMTVMAEIGIPWRLGLQPQARGLRKGAPARQCPVHLVLPAPLSLQPQLPE